MVAPFSQVTAPDFLTGTGLGVATVVDAVVMGAGCGADVAEASVMGAGSGVDVAEASVVGAACGVIVAK